MDALQKKLLLCIIRRSMVLLFLSLFQSLRYIGLRLFHSLYLWRYIQDVVVCVCVLHHYCSIDVDILFLCYCNCGSVCVDMFLLLMVCQHLAEEVSVLRFAYLPTRSRETFSSHELWSKSSLLFFVHFIYRGGEPVVVAIYTIFVKEYTTWLLVWLHMAAKCWAICFLLFASSLLFFLFLLPRFSHRSYVVDKAKRVEDYLWSNQAKASSLSTFTKSIFVPISNKQFSRIYRIYSNSSIFIALIQCNPLLRVSL